MPHHLSTRSWGHYTPAPHAGHAIVEIISHPRKHRSKHSRPPLIVSTIPTQALLPRWHRCKITMHLVLGIMAALQTQNQSGENVNLHKGFSRDLPIQNRNWPPPMRFLRWLCMLSYFWKPSFTKYCLYCTSVAAMHAFRGLIYPGYTKLDKFISQTFNGTWRCYCTYCKHNPGRLVSERLFVV